MALLSEQLGRLLQVLQVLVPEFFLLLDELVGLLVERQQVRIQLVAAVALAATVHHVVGLEGLLQVIPVLLLLSFVVGRIYWVVIVVGVIGRAIIIANIIVYIRIKPILVRWLLLA